MERRRTRRTTLLVLSVLAAGTVVGAGSSALADTGREPAAELRLVVDDGSGRQDCPGGDRAPDTSLVPDGAEGL